MVYMEQKEKAIKTTSATVRLQHQYHVLYIFRLPPNFSLGCETKFGSESLGLRLNISPNFPWSFL